MFLSMPCFFSCEKGAQSRSGLLFITAYQDRPALTGSSVGLFQTQMMEYGIAHLGAALCIPVAHSL